jgi:hypothetical protein
LSLPHRTTIFYCHFVSTTFSIAAVQVARAVLEKEVEATNYPISPAGLAK